MILSIAKSAVPGDQERLAHGIIGMLAGIAATALFLRFDKKKCSDIGLRWERLTIARFFIGVVTGLLLMGLLAASVMYFYKVHIALNPNSNLWHFLLMTLPLIPLAYMEELGFRAYPLKTLENTAGIRFSIIVTSVLFALYHVANGWTLASSLYGPAVWGLVFGLAAIYSGGIAMPTGLHYAANLTTSAFGAAGNTVSIWIISQPNASPIQQAGIDWATIIPSISLLVFAIIGIELYLRRKAAHASKGD